MSASLARSDGSGQMFDRIARRYDLLNRLMSFGIDKRWRRKLVAALALKPGAQALDLATGTGDVALAICRSQPRISVVGTDPSPNMLEVAEGKRSRHGFDDALHLEVGVAEHIERPDQSVDAVSISFGIRNVPDRPAALREMARVTRAGGRVVILELSEPGSGVLGALARFHVHQVVPRLGALLSGSREYRYLQSSIAAFPPADEFAALMRQCGLEVLGVDALTFGVAHLYVATPAQEAS